MSNNLVLLFILIFVLIFPAGLKAEDTPLAGKIDAILLFFEIADKSGIGSEQAVLLYETLLYHLTKISKDLVIREVPAAQPARTAAEKTELAQGYGVQAWLSVKIQGQSKVQTLTVQVYELASAQLVIDTTIRKEDGLSVRTIERSYWNEVSTLLKTHYRPAAPSIEEGVTETSGEAEADTTTVQRQAAQLESGGEGELIVRARPGSRIYGLSRRPLLVGDDALVVATVTVPGTYSIEGRCAGFYTVEESLYIDQKRTLLNLDQEPGSRFALDLYTLNFNFFGAAFSYYLKPNAVFTKAGITSYMFGIFLENERFDWYTQDTTESVFTGYPLIHFYLTIGAYVNPDNDLFRFYGAFSLFTRIFFSSGMALEPIAPFGMQPALGVEISPFPKLRFYTEWAPVFYLTKYPDVLLASYQKNAGDDYDSPFFRLPFMVIALTNFQIGVRWIL